MIKTPAIVKHSIKDKIHTIRGLQVMLDSDLAELYGVETKALNKSVKRNIERFPEHFMFQLAESEYLLLRSQNVTSSNDSALRFQNDTLEERGVLRSQNATLEAGRGKHRKYLPYAFTEQGISMLSGVLRSKTAIRVSIQIMDAFVAMRRFISKNAEIFRRLDNVEKKHIEYDKKFEKVFDALHAEKPKQGIFFDGHVFDAHKFVCDLIRSAEKSIILIDNYIDESVLTLLSKRKRRVSVRIYTRYISERLMLDLKKYDSQYGPIEVKEFKASHDRFMIIDDGTVYHIGASLKDLGKKWFAFSRFDMDTFELIRRLR
jgi:hypothetical protein